MKEHIEGSKKCVFNKNHAGQKNYRDSALLPITIPAMAKIQEKLGVSGETANPITAFIKLGELAGIKFVPSDFDRRKGAEQEKVVTAKADTTDPVNAWIMKQYETGLTQEKIISLMKSNGWTDEKLSPYFKKKAVIPLPPC